jgi:hypothetical protein
MRCAVDRCHNIWKSYQEDTVELFCQDSKARKLWTSVGFLGRLAIAYNVLVRAAERLSRFKELKIIPTPFRNAGTQYRTLSLADTLQSLGIDFSDSAVRELFGQNSSKNRLMHKFSENMGCRPQFHAEAQLVLYLMQTKKMATCSRLKYLGCSKYSCLLCYRFVAACGGFRTRGCHGKVFGAWTIPEMDGLVSEHIEMILSSLTDIQEDVKSRILDSNQRLSHLKRESTVGGSSIVTRTSFVEEPYLGRLVTDHLNEQRNAYISNYIRGM